MPCSYYATESVKQTILQISIRFGIGIIKISLSGTFLDLSIIPLTVTLQEIQHTCCELRTENGLGRAVGTATRPRNGSRVIDVRFPTFQDT